MPSWWWAHLSDYRMSQLWMTTDVLPVQDTPHLLAEAHWLSRSHWYNKCWPHLYDFTASYDMHSIRATFLKDDIVISCFYTMKSTCPLSDPTSRLSCGLTNFCSMWITHQQWLYHNTCLHIQHLEGKQLLSIKQIMKEAQELMLTDAAELAMSSLFVITRLWLPWCREVGRLAILAHTSRVCSICCWAINVRLQDNPWYSFWYGTSAYYIKHTSNMYEKVMRCVLCPLDQICVIRGMKKKTSALLVYNCLLLLYTCSKDRLCLLHPCSSKLILIIEVEGTGLYKVTLTQAKINSKYLINCN